MRINPLRANLMLSLIRICPTDPVEAEMILVLRRPPCPVATVTILRSPVVCSRLILVCRQGNIDWMMVSCLHPEYYGGLEVLMVIQ